MTEARQVRVVFMLTVVGGIGLLTLAVWPGMTEVILTGFPFVCVSLPLLAFWVLLLVGSALRDLAVRSERPARNRWWGVWSAGVMLATLGLFWLHIPQRVVFRFYSSDLRGLVDNAPAGEHRGVELDRQVGPYHVDRYAADKRGGVFFRTATGPDGIGPDQMSYGFAFHPNGQGTPFGNAQYRQRRLFGEWYVFAASDDW